MKHIIFWVTVTICLFLLVLNPTFSAQERRIALVIGNGAYKSAPLRNPVNDAGDIADALQELGFNVIIKINADHRAMKKAIRRFGKKLRSGGIGLFFFAGHGLQVKGQNFLVPVDADIETEADVEFEAVNAGRILVQMKEAGNHLNIIILDACRDNPFGRSFRSSGRGLVKMDAPTGSILAYATAPGSVASDGPGRNGRYTSALLKHMVIPGLKIEDVFKQVRIDVINASGEKQVPWESSSLTGEFYFNAERGITVVKDPKPESPKVYQKSADKDMLFWQSIQNSDDPALFEAYLEKFPNGTFSAIAKKKVEKLEHLKLEIEKKKLDEEQKRLEAEKKRLIKKETPKKVSSTKLKRIKLRNQPTELWNFEIKEMVARNNFYVKNRSIGLKNFQNSFIDNGDETIADQTTKLMWQKNGSSSRLFWPNAKNYVADLNQRKYIGYDNWRIPTIEELISLIDPIVNDAGQNINSLFNPHQWICWSIDPYGDHPESHRIVPYWVVMFNAGTIGWAATRTAAADDGDGCIREQHFVRAVRSMQDD